MKRPKKIKRISIGLDPYQLELFNEACCTLTGRMHPPSRSDCSHVLELAVHAVSKAIVEQGQVPHPFAVDVRYATEEENNDRLNERIPERGANKLPLPHETEYYVTGALRHDPDRAIKLAVRLEREACAIRIYHAAIKGHGAKPPEPRKPTPNIISVQFNALQWRQRYGN